MPTLRRARPTLLALEKEGQVTAFQTHSDAPTRGKPPLAVGGHPGSTAAPAPRRGEPGAGGAGGGPRRAAPGGWALPSRGRESRQPPAAACPAAASIAGRGRRCQTPPGGRGSSQPGPLRGEPARPPHASESTKRGQGRGEKGVPPLGSSCVSGKAHLQLPRPESGPSAPARPRSSSGFGGSLFAGIFPSSPSLPFPCPARARTVTNVPCKDFLPKDNPPEQKQTEKVVTNPFWMAVTRLLPAPAPPAICIQKNPENSRLPPHLAQTLRPRLAGRSPGWGTLPAAEGSGAPPAPRPATAAPRASRQHPPPPSTAPQNAAPPLRPAPTGVPVHGLGRRALPLRGARLLLQALQLQAHPRPDAAVPGHRVPEHAAAQPAGA